MPVMPIRLPFKIYSTLMGHVLILTRESAPRLPPKSPPRAQQQQKK